MIPFMDTIAVTWAILTGILVAVLAVDAAAKWVKRRFPDAYPCIGLALLSVVVLGPLIWGALRLTVLRP